MSTEDFESIFVAASETSLRIDSLLKGRFPTFSRTYFQNLLEKGAILLNGERVKKRICPEEGDEIEICFQATEELSLTPEPIPLEVLYEDEHLLAVQKPAGMVVHPAPGHSSGTFVNALLAHCQGKVGGTDFLRPGIVHRLDKETTGVLLAAKTTSAHQKLIELFSLRRIEKLYLAICCSRPQNGTVQAPIGRHPVQRKEMAILSDGREAITEFSTLAYNQQLSLVLAKPKTGRTHQIRVHLKHLKTPILGDALYGNRSLNQALNPPRMLLHAYRLSLLHPITQVPLTLTAPIPEDLKYWMEKLCGPSHSRFFFSHIGQ